VVALGGASVFSLSCVLGTSAAGSGAGASTGLVVASSVSIPGAGSSAATKH